MWFAMPMLSHVPVVPVATGAAGVSPAKGLKAAFTAASCPGAAMPKAGAISRAMASRMTVPYRSSPIMPA
jgi:hypothetical protein